MQVLLDTHAFLWFISGDLRLSKNAREKIEDSQNDRYVSAASCWEIAIKHGLGRLDFGAPLESVFNHEIEGNGLQFLDISRKHLLQLRQLPLVHGDPFDRLLVAQAKIENLTLLSIDEKLDAYKVRRLW